MGDAKRRKQLDPQFGKVRHHQVQQQPRVDEITDMTRWTSDDFKAQVDRAHACGNEHFFMVLESQENLNHIKQLVSQLEADGWEPPMPISIGLA